MSWAARKAAKKASKEVYKAKLEEMRAQELMNMIEETKRMKSLFPQTGKIRRLMKKRDKHLRRADKHRHEARVQEMKMRMSGMSKSEKEAYIAQQGMPQRQAREQGQGHQAIIYDSGNMPRSVAASAAASVMRSGRQSRSHPAPSSHAARADGQRRASSGTPASTAAAAAATTRPSHQRRPSHPFMKDNSATHDTNAGAGLKSNGPSAPPPAPPAAPPAAVYTSNLMMNKAGLGPVDPRMAVPSAPPSTSSLAPLGAAPPAFPGSGAQQQQQQQQQQPPPRVGVVGEEAVPVAVRIVPGPGWEQ